MKWIFTQFRILWKIFLLLKWIKFANDIQQFSYIKHKVVNRTHFQRLNPRILHFFINFWNLYIFRCICRSSVGISIYIFDRSVLLKITRRKVLKVAINWTKVEKLDSRMLISVECRSQSFYLFSLILNFKCFVSA